MAALRNFGRMQRSTLISLIRESQSFLCVGLDTDPAKLPPHLPATREGILQFNRAIIDATAPYCVAYKVNTAFYEAMGREGWDILTETAGMLPDTHFRIADAKRGDIGNTSTQYAKAFFEAMPFDAVTVAPYMGEDSVAPFLQFPGKWAIVLALTSNAGSADFQQLKINGTSLYETVLQRSQHWGTPENLMYVVGATHPEAIRHIRSVVPEHFLLVPGVGAQGGSLAEVCRHGLNDDVGLLVNASRSILYAGKGEDYAEQAAAEAKHLQMEMADILQNRYGN
jgi:orotidine-5'-phosphate decarboxylase